MLTQPDPRGASSCLCSLSYKCRHLRRWDRVPQQAGSVCGKAFIFPSKIPATAPEEVRAVRLLACLSTFRVGCCSGVGRGGLGHGWEAGVAGPPRGGRQEGLGMVWRQRSPNAVSRGAGQNLRPTTPGDLLCAHHGVSASLPATVTHKAGQRQADAASPGSWKAQVTKAIRAKPPEGTSQGSPIRAPLCSYPQGRAWTSSRDPGPATGR